MSDQQKKRPRMVPKHRKRSLGPWLVPLAVILAVIYFLPRLAELLG